MPPRDLDDQVVVRRLTAIRELVDLLARQGEVSGAQLRDDLVLRLAVERALSQLVDLASDVNSRGSPSPRTTVRRSTRLREPD